MANVSPENTPNTSWAPLSSTAQAPHPLLVAGSAEAVGCALPTGAGEGAAGFFATSDSDTTPG